MKHIIELAHSTVTLEMPDSYNAVPEDKMKMVLKTNDNIFGYLSASKGYLITVADKVLDKSLGADVDSLLNTYCQTYRRTIPGFSDPVLGKREISGTMFGALHFRSTTAKEDYYTITFITLVDDVEIVINMQSRFIQFGPAYDEFMRIINSALVTKKQDAKTA